MERTYCHLCGTKLEKPTAKGKPWHCPNCGQIIYENPRPAATVAILNSEGQILLATRAKEPHKGKQDLPGGFVEIGESFLEAAQRELQEELGLTAQDYTELEYLGSGTSEYPWGHEVLPAVVTIFKTTVKPGAHLDAKDDVAAVNFTDIAAIERVDIAWEVEYRFIKSLQKGK